MILTDIAYAMSQGASQSGQQTGGGSMMPLITLGLIFLVFYFLLIRPQQKQQKKMVQMRENLRPGDRVITTGGIFGTIESVNNESIILKVAEKVKIEITKSAIAGLREGKQKS